MIELLGANSMHVLANEDAKEEGELENEGESSLKWGESSSSLVGGAHNEERSECRWLCFTLELGSTLESVSTLGLGSTLESYLTLISHPIYETSLTLKSCPTLELRSTLKSH